MTSIADSDAYFDPERMLAQHQAALTLLQSQLARPQMKVLNWLDLACGRGQIIASLDENLSAVARAKIHFVGFDVDNSHIRTAERAAQTAGIGETRFAVGSLAEFHNSEMTQGPWDFITLTNTIHEITPNSLATVLAQAFVRLADNGCLFIYDMEQLPKLELGAIPWSNRPLNKSQFCAKGSNLDLRGERVWK